MTFSSPGDLPGQGTEHGSPALQADSLLAEPAGKPKSAQRKHMSLGGLGLIPKMPQLCPFPGFPLEVRWKSSLQCISEMNRLFSEKASVSKSGLAPATDVLLELDTVRELSSGVSRYRDFIRQLPIHLSKYILSMWGLLGGFSSTASPSSWPRWEVPRPTSCSSRFAG